MKRTIISLVSAVCVLALLAGCDQPNSNDETGLKGKTCLTAAQIVEKMNEAFDEDFTLKSTSSKSSDGYKYTYVELETESLPGKTIKAYDYWEYGYTTNNADGFWDYNYVHHTPELVPTVTTSAAKSVNIPITNSLVTDYCAIKYEADVIEHFETVMKPLIEGVDYKIILQSKYVPINYEGLSFKSLEDYLDHGFGRHNVYVAVKRDWYENCDEDCQTRQDYRTVCANLSESEYNIDIYGDFYFRFVWPLEGIDDINPSEMNDEWLTGVDRTYHSETFNVQ